MTDTIPTTDAKPTAKLGWLTREAPDQRTLTGAARVWNRICLNLAWLSAISGLLLILFAASNENVSSSLYDYDALVDNLSTGAFEFAGWTAIGYAIVFVVVAISIQRASLSDPSKA